mmetsp:Transcript_46648/g.101630  ORF Transcript_46648/g.101630 Transcript_46648/m.101630 type:complete len:317 (+) Transcript_46648:10-960(+)
MSETAPPQPDLRPCQGAPCGASAGPSQRAVGALGALGHFCLGLCLIRAVWAITRTFCRQSPPCLRIWQFLAAEFTAANLCPGGGVELCQGKFVGSWSHEHSKEFTRFRLVLWIFHLKTTNARHKFRLTNKTLALPVQCPPPSLHHAAMKFQHDLLQTAHMQSDFRANLLEGDNALLIRVKFTPEAANIPIEKHLPATLAELCVAKIALLMNIHSPPARQYCAILPPEEVAKSMSSMCATSPFQALSLDAGPVRLCMEASSHKSFIRFLPVEEFIPLVFLLQLRGGLCARVGPRVLWSGSSRGDTFRNQHCLTIPSI